MLFSLPRFPAPPGAPRSAAVWLLYGAVAAGSVAATAQPVSPRNPNLAAQTPTIQTGQAVTAGSLAQSIQNSERTQNADNLLLTYGQAVTTPELARAAIGQLLGDYYQLRNQAQTADQATQAVSEAMLRFMVLQTAQNQILVQQNQQLLQQQERIIELLEAQSPPSRTPSIRR